MAKEILSETDIACALERHKCGDWGEISPEDWARCNACMETGYLLGNIMDYILGLPNNDDHFHREYNRPELCQRELMDHLSDKTPEYYYSDILIPSGKTLADFYKEVSL